MLRIDLLRSLPRVEKSEDAGQRGSPGPLKPILAVLLLLLAGSLVSVWLTKPTWLNLKSVTGMRGGNDAARADSVNRAEILHAQTSRLVDARQAAVVNWLTELESALAGRAAEQVRGSLRLTNSTYSPSGAFILEGTATSAEELSAFQEALVIIPGMDLQGSRATEDSTQGGHFTFRFEGLVAPVTPDSGTAALNDSNDPAPRTLRTSRILEAKAIGLQLDTLILNASLGGFSFSQSGEVRISQSGGLQVHSYRLKGGMAESGTPELHTTATDSAVIASLRNLLEQERHRGSPFAVQRVTVLQGPQARTVFLDILALTP